MLLAIDIGNTNINFGVFKDNKLVRKFNFPTQKYSFRTLKYSLGKIHIEDCIICSVVPKILRALKSDLKRIFGKQPCVVGKSVRVPIKNLYRNPEQVGCDRLVNAYAGIMLYGAPLIIVDFGTAITFDVISKRKEYLGGMILPGLGIALDALARRTALLPKIKLNRPKEFIGRDTKNSMLSGVVYGFAALADALVERIKDKIGKEVKVVGAGGNIQLVRNYCKGIDEINRDLTLTGLNLIYSNIIQKESSG